MSDFEYQWNISGDIGIAVVDTALEATRKAAIHESSRFAQFAASRACGQINLLVCMGHLDVDSGELLRDVAIAWAESAA